MEFLVAKSTVHVFGYLSSLALALLALWGLIGFFPRRHQRASSLKDHNTGPAWLILAIWVGFLGLFCNAVWWRVLGDPAVHYGYLTVTEHRYWGNLLDMVWKGLGAVGVYLHFYARWKSIIDPEVRAKWSPLLMTFYPNDGHWAYRALTFWRRTFRKKSK